MRVFILLAILFFSWRVFAQSFDYYYIDEYMRAKEDPEYSQYVKEKQREKIYEKQAVGQFKLEKEYEAYLQEQSRKAFVANRAREVVVDNSEELERQDDVRKEKEEQQQIAEELQYVQHERIEEQKKADRKPDRMFASVASEKHTRVAKDKRKYRLKVTKVIHKE